MVASDGGVFTFGDAHFYGSLGGVPQAVADGRDRPDPHRQRLLAGARQPAGVRIRRRAHLSRAGLALGVCRTGCRTTAVGIRARVRTCSGRRRCSSAMALLVFLMRWPHWIQFATTFVFVAFIHSRWLPWQFEIHDDGIQLLFPFGRRLFLSRSVATVRVDIVGAMVYNDRHGKRWFGYPLHDGILYQPGQESLLRAAFVEPRLHRHLTVCANRVSAGARPRRARNDSVRHHRGRCRRRPRSMSGCVCDACAYERGHLRVEQVVEQRRAVREVGELGARRLGLIGPQPDPVVHRAPLAVELGRERRVPEVGVRTRRRPRVGGPAADRAVVGVAGHAVGSERHDEVGLDVGDERRDRVGAVVLRAACRLRSRAGAARRRRARRGCCAARCAAARRAGAGGHASGSLVPCSPSVAVTTTTRSPRRRNSAIRPADV